MSNPYKKCLRCEKRKRSGWHRKVTRLGFERFVMSIHIVFGSRILCEDCMQELMKYATDALHNKG